MLRLCKEYISISLVWRVDATVMQGVHLHQFSLEGGCYGYARSLSEQGVYQTQSWPMIVPLA